MSFSFHPEAEEEFLDALSYYEDCESGLGLDMAREVHATIQKTVDYPSMWPFPEGDIRSYAPPSKPITGGTDRIRNQDPHAQ